MSDRFGSAAPTQTAIKGFLKGEAATSSKTVRLFKQFLIDVKEAAERDFRVEQETAPLLHEYETFLAQPSKPVYGQSFTATINLLSFAEFRPKMILRWRFELLPSGLYRFLEEDLPTKEGVIHGFRSGYAMCSSRGHLLGIMRDTTSEQHYRFTFEPQFSHIIPEHDGFYNLVGVLTKIADRNELSFVRHDIHAGVLLGAGK